MLDTLGSHLMLLRSNKKTHVVSTYLPLLGFALGRHGNFLLFFFYLFIVLLEVIFFITVVVRCHGCCLFFCSKCSPKQVMRLNIAFRSGWFQQLQLISVPAAVLFRVDFHVYFVREMVSLFIVLWRGDLAVVTNCGKNSGRLGVLHSPWYTFSNYTFLIFLFVSDSL
jgi:hypothetical protein